MTQPKTLLLALLSLLFFFATPTFGQELPDGLYAKIYTSKGVITAQLYYEEVPNTVANFVALAEGTKRWMDPRTGAVGAGPLYKDIVFHRVIPDFMVQTGDPLGMGSGGPGYNFGDEFNPKLKHDKPGVLSMANRGPNTNGSQFFITHVATPWLNFKHSIFGQVIQGQNIVDAIQQGDKLHQIKILRRGEKAMAFRGK